jgi:formate-dependent nitrite reductase membrane component NrfD
MWTRSLVILLAVVFVADLVYAIRNRWTKKSSKTPGRQ